MSAYLTPAKAAELLPFGNAAYVRDLLKSGKLRGYQPTGPSGRWLVEEDSVHEWVRSGSNDTTRRRRRRAS